METVAELRTKLQTPRRPYDTFYGRYVMRSLSIYITAVLSRTPVTPMFVTLASVLVGWLGCVYLVLGQFLWGILLLNGWYLLDHVDGELSRYRKSSSPTGLYFDTLTNALVPPLAFLALGFRFMQTSTSFWWMGVGISAFYASLMLLIIPFCESAVILQCSNGQKKFDSNTMSHVENEQKRRFELVRMLFSGIHQLITFPTVLCLMTVSVVFFHLFDAAKVIILLKSILFSYAVLATLVWVFQVANKIMTRKIDNLMNSV